MSQPRHIPKSREATVELDTGYLRVRDASHLHLQIDFYSVSHDYYPHGSYNEGNPKTTFAHKKT